MSLTQLMRDHVARLTEAEKDIMLKRVFLQDDLNRRTCLAKVNHAAWRAALSPSELLIHAHSLETLNAALNRPE